MAKNPEEKRLQFLIERDGIEGALDFAKRTRKMYRRHILLGHIDRSYRKTFIESYVAFKQFIAEHQEHYD